MPRHIAVVTTSRADFGHLHWPLKHIEAHADLDASLIAMGAHLSPEFGRTLDAIESAGFHADETIECLLSSDSDVGMAKTIGLAVLSLSDTLGRMRPDMVLLPADRYEMLAVANVALALGIPIAHIEGGDISEGAIDDAVRNALTKLSHLHFTPTVAATRRVLAMGEERWRVHRTGAPSLDHLVEREPQSREAVGKQLGLALVDGYALVAFHPVTLLSATRAEADELFAALESLRRQIIFCFPNADAGGRDLIAMTRQFCARHEHAHLFINLDHWLYWNLLRHAALMIGNSSSGIMESPSLQIPTVNVGVRQRGREQARNIIDTTAQRARISAAIERAVGDSFRASLAGMVNPYGDGHAAQRIAAALAAAPDRATLLSKRALPLHADSDCFINTERPDA